MADEGEQDSGGGSVLKKYGPLALIVLMAQAVLGWVLLTQILHTDRPGTQEQQSTEQLIDDRPAPSGPEGGGRGTEHQELPFIYAPTKLAEMTANPAGTNSQRFVMFSVQLGIVAENTAETDPEKRNLTEKMAEHPEVTEKLNEYVALMKSIIVRIVRQKTIPELEGENLQATADEIRESINAEVLEEAFKVEPDKPGFLGLFGGEKKNKIKVIVQDVIFTDIIVQ
ncbi:MAG: flagellar basal body-associated FliL family protein [Candidatus Latescibacterota bacterium]|jgi:flagellar basal body-associated protein FliL